MYLAINSKYVNIIYNVRMVNSVESVALDWIIAMAYSLMRVKSQLSIIGGAADVRRTRLWSCGFPQVAVLVAGERRGLLVTCYNQLGRIFDMTCWYEN